LWRIWTVYKKIQNDMHANQSEDTPKGREKRGKSRISFITGTKEAGDSEENEHDDEEDENDEHADKIMHMPTSFSGALSKRGQFNRGWRDRFCVLEGNVLEYATLSTVLTNGKRRGSIDLSTTHSIKLLSTDSDEAGGRPFVFALIQSRRTFYFAAKTAQEADLWVGLLRKAVAETREVNARRDSAWLE